MPVPEQIRGRAFFPGGLGLWEPGPPLPEFPVGGVMVLGHDFHSEAGYRESLRRGGEPATQPTWKSVLKLLENARIPKENCFFTNFYLGLRVGTATTGKFPGACDPVFVEHCRRFLIEQLRVQRPALILVLGVHVARALGKLSPQLGPWARGRGVKHFDAVGPVQNGITFNDLRGFLTTIVVLTHPSLRPVNIRHRRYGQATGNAAEMAMLRDGLVASGIALA